jgi:hypothetical protein
METNINSDHTEDIMKQMEELWKNIPTNRYPMKGNNGYIGYGYREGKRKKGYCVEKRKVGRDIRKYHFDRTMSWNLDTSVMNWLSDNVGGFFRKCGTHESWSDYDINGNKTEDTKKRMEAEYARENAYLKYLDEFLRTCDDKTFNKFRDFVCPALYYISQNTISYPGGFTIDSWKETVYKMWESFANGKLSKEFIDNFYSLWD